ncbi:phage portal protein, HK97 family [Polaromonas sp. OV174]|uniref:phage portal protein n=1 Tax=Polaromonas sp. OV174 TaxID=1855300 RepID=UPI0008EF8449|nr:phage portal protein [Polaromonas sp. OV174]SFB96491.1 phage portal protein, HK97 family [Polaromonas sp. OV174]
MNVIRRTMLRLALKGVELSPSMPEGWKFLGGGETWAKVNVDEVTQLQISAAFSAIRLIAETVGTMPLHLYRKTSKGRVRATDHPLYALVHDQPNEYMTAVEWKEAMVVSLTTMGQSYNYVDKFESTGRIISIQPVHKNRVKPEIDMAGGLTYWLTMRNGQRLRLKRPQICPIRGFGGVGDLEGYAPHKIHANSMALTIAVEKYGAEFFGSGGRPSGILTTDQEFKAVQRDSIRENFQKYLADSWRTNRLPLLENGTKYQQVTTPNNEAQFIETRKQQIAEMARIYRVPLHMLMEMDKASYANTEQANKHFLDYTLLSYLKRIELALNSCLLTAAERVDHYFEFDVRGLLRGDSTQRAAYYVTMRNAGAITQNEIRDLENMPQIEGADDLHVPLNMAPSDMLASILGDKNKGN